MISTGFYLSLSDCDGVVDLWQEQRPRSSVLNYLCPPKGNYLHEASSYSRLVLTRLLSAVTWAVEIKHDWYLWPMLPYPILFGENQQCKGLCPKCHPIPYIVHYFWPEWIGCHLRALVCIVFSYPLQGAAALREIEHLTVIPDGPPY